MPVSQTITWRWIASVLARGSKREVRLRIAHRCVRCHWLVRQIASRLVRQICSPNRSSAHLPDHSSAHPPDGSSACPPIARRLFGQIARWLIYLSDRLPTCPLDRPSACNIITREYSTQELTCDNDDHPGSHGIPMFMDSTQELTCGNDDHPGSHGIPMFMDSPLRLNKVLYGLKQVTLLWHPPCWKTLRFCA